LPTSSRCIETSTTPVSIVDVLELLDEPADAPAQSRFPAKGFPPARSAEIRISLNDLVRDAAQRRTNRAGVQY
jgi:hypothetical protein